MRQISPARFWSSQVPFGSAYEHRSDRDDAKQQTIWVEGSRRTAFRCFVALGTAGMSGKGGLWTAAFAEQQLNYGRSFISTVLLCALERSIAGWQKPVAR